MQFTKQVLITLVLGFITVQLTESIPVSYGPSHEGSDHTPSQYGNHGYKKYINGGRTRRRSNDSHQHEFGQKSHYSDNHENTEDCDEPWNGQYGQDNDYSGYGAPKHENYMKGGNDEPKYIPSHESMGTSYNGDMPMTQEPAPEVLMEEELIEEKTPIDFPALAKRGLVDDISDTIFEDNEMFERTDSDRIRLVFNVSSTLLENETEQAEDQTATEEPMIDEKTLGLKKREMTSESYPSDFSEEYEDDTVAHYGEHDDYEAPADDCEEIIPVYKVGHSPFYDQKDHENDDYQWKHHNGSKSPSYEWESDKHQQMASYEWENDKDHQISYDDQVPSEECKEESPDHHWEYYEGEMPTEEECEDGNSDHWKKQHLAPADSDHTKGWSKHGNYWQKIMKKVSDITGETTYYKIIKVIVQWNPHTEDQQPHYPTNEEECDETKDETKGNGHMIKMYKKTSKAQHQEYNGESTDETYHVSEHDQEYPMMGQEEPECEDDQSNSDKYPPHY